MINATEVYTRMKVSYVGNRDPKPAIVFQFENMLKLGGFEQLAIAGNTCICNAYENEDGPIEHRIGEGLCKQVYRTPVDDLKKMLDIAGYKANAQLTLRAWMDAVLQAGLSSKGVEAYHRFKPALEWIIRDGGFVNNDRIFAQHALRELYLSQSVNEPTEWWLDAYTRDVDEEASTEMETNRTAQRWLKDEAASVQEGTFTMNGIEMKVDAVQDAEDTIISAYLAMKDPETHLAIYTKEEAIAMSRKTRNTMVSPLGDTEIFSDFEGDEDRGFIPPPLLKDFHPDLSAIDKLPVKNYRDFTAQCWERARDAFPETPFERGKRQRLYKGENAMRDQWTKLVSQARIDTFVHLWFDEMYERVTENTQTAEWIAEEIADLSSPRFQGLSGIDKDFAPIWGIGESEQRDIEKLSAQTPVEVIKRPLPELVQETEYDMRHIVYRDMEYVQVANDVEVRKSLIKYANDLAKRGDDPVYGSCLQASAVMIFPFVVDEDEELQPSQLDVTKIKISELSKDLQECLEAYGEEIAERSDKRGKLRAETNIDLKLDEEVYVKKLLATMPELSPIPSETQSFVLAHIAAMASGANADTATSTAWNAWRTAMAPDGQREYEASIALGQSKSEAWKAFWGKCGKAIPRPQSKILKATKAGLVIAPLTREYPALTIDGEIEDAEAPKTREIGWGAAVTKMRAGEFDLSNKDALITGLTKAGWQEAAYFIKLLKA